MIENIGIPEFPMLIMVTGGRNYNDRNTVHAVFAPLNTDPKPTLIHGGAPGLDTIASSIAANMGWLIESFPADWNTYGRKKAGHIRNHHMIRRKPDLCIAFPGGPGTDACRRAAQKAGIPVCLVTYDPDSDTGISLVALSSPESNLLPLDGFPDE